MQAMLSSVILGALLLAPARGQPEPEWFHHPRRPCPKHVGSGPRRPCQPSRHSLKFGCILPLSGEKGQAGLAEQLAIQMSLTDSNLGGGKAQLICVDTQCDPGKSAAAMKSLAERGVLAVVGDICSGASAAAAVVATAERIPLISAASGASSLSQVDYFYRTVPSDAYQGLAASRLVASRGSKKVGLLREATVYGSGLAADFTTDFVGSQGGAVPIVFNVSAQPPPTAAEAAVAAFKAAAAAGQINAVFISSNNNSLVAAFLKQAASQQLGLPLFGGGGVADPALFKLVQGGPSALGQLEASTVSPGSQAFIDRFRAISQDKYSYHPGVARAYDAVATLLRAYHKTPRPWVGQELRANLQQVQFLGVSGPVSFDAYGDLVPSDSSYVAVTFDLDTQQLHYGNPISLLD